MPTNDGAKSAAEAAYLAFTKELGTAFPGASWDKLPPLSKRCWGNAAEAARAFAPVQFIDHDQTRAG